MINRILLLNDKLVIQIWKNESGLLYIGNDVLFFFNPQKIKIFKGTFIYLYENDKKF